MKQAIPVAGVDVSKHFSDMCILAPNNDILSRMKIYHDLTSMGRVAAELRRVEAVCGVAPVVVMESTSHYHLILFQFFRDAGYEVIVVNPIYLDSIFPGYDKVFSDVGGASSRAVLKECPTPQILLLKTEEELAGIIRCAGYKGITFGRKKAELLHAAAEKAVRLGIFASGNSAVVTAVLEVLEALLSSVQEIERDIKALIVQDTYLQKNIALLQTIPGLGPHSAIVILSEIGDFTLFQRPKQLAAYFGLDPSQRQSGCFSGSKNKLSKRGSAYVRAMLHMAAVTSVIPQAKRPAANPVLLAYYEKKCKEKPTRVALCAVMHKLSNIIFAVLRDQKPFELRQPDQHALRLGVAPAA